MDVAAFVYFRGLQRSGNHLVINWLRHGFAGPVHFAQSVPSPDAPAVANARATINAIAACPADAAAMILSDEEPDRNPEWVVTEALRQAAAALRPARHIVCYLLRDPLNWIASYGTKVGLISPDGVAELERRWLAVYRLWQDARRRPDHVAVSFNSFVTSPTYRHALHAPFGCRVSRRADRHVLDTLWEPPGVTEGSSFDTAAVRNGTLRPRRMDVLGRFRRYPSLLQWLDPATVAIARDVFAVPGLPPD